VPFNAIYFSTYAGFKELARKMVKKEDLNAVELLVASSLAGSLAAGLDTPADGIKTRLQNGQGQYKGVVDCFQQVWAKEGLRGLFRGWTARVLIISPLFGITMMCYETLQSYFFPHTRVGLDLIDKDFESARKSRQLDLTENKIWLRYGEHMPEDNVNVKFNDYTFIPTSSSSSSSSSSSANTTSGSGSSNVKSS
jgi:hypothetical protein